MTEVSGPTAAEIEVVERLRRLNAAVVERRLDPAAAEAVRDLLAAAEEAVAGGAEPRAAVDGVAGPGRARRRDLSPFSGAVNPLAPPLSLTTGARPDGRPSLLARARFTSEREGPPHTVHGGILAGCFDEVLGAAQRLTRGGGGMTGRLVVRYRRPTPLGEDVTIEGWVHDERHRRVVMRGECRVGDVVTAEAEGVFLRVDFEGLAAGMRDRRVGEDTPPAPPPRS